MTQLYMCECVKGEQDGMYDKKYLVVQMANKAFHCDLVSPQMARKQ